jgi:hypothetical protein
MDYIRHTLLLIREDGTGICQKCGEVKLHKAGIRQGKQIWRCKNVANYATGGPHKGWIHRMLSLDIETLTGICSNCGPVKLVTQGKKSDGSPKFRCQNVCKTEKKEVRPLRHALSDIDEVNKTAVCLICGPVEVKMRKSRNGDIRWRCAVTIKSLSELAHAKKKAANTKEPRKKHILSNVNPEARTADCKKCGPVRINKGCVSKNGILIWGCAVATRERNLHRDYGITQAEYLELYQRQEGKCAVCRLFFDNLVIDHDHSRERVNGRAAIRELLCHECNLGLGAVADSISSCENMLQYLSAPLVVFPDQQKETTKTKRTFLHRLSDYDVEKRTALCEHCGPTKINRDGYMRNGEISWRCAGSSRRKPIDRRNIALKSHFGINNKDYDYLLELQGGVCKICELPPKEGKYLAVDHQHERGQDRDEKSENRNDIRGLLCTTCNVALGQLHDDPVRIQSAIRYLQRHQSPFQVPATSELRDIDLSPAEFADLDVDQILHGALLIGAGPG